MTPTQEREALAAEAKWAAEEMRKVSRGVPVAGQMNVEEWGSHKRLEARLHAAIDALAASPAVVAQRGCAGCGGKPANDNVPCSVCGGVGAVPHAAPAAASDEPTEAMVEAYLAANDAYWRGVDALPTKLGKWRHGTPSEATRVSLRAALAARAPQAAVSGAADPVSSDAGEQTGPVSAAPTPQPTVQAEAVPVSEDAIERLRLEHCDRGILQKGAAHNFARAVLALSAPPVGEPVAWDDLDDAGIAEALRRLLHREPTLAEVTVIQKAALPTPIYAAPSPSAPAGEKR